MPINTQRLREKRRQAHYRDQFARLRYGLVGRIVGSSYEIDVTGKPNWVWVRVLRGDMVVGNLEAINVGVAKIPGTPVRIDDNEDGDPEIRGLNPKEAEAFLGPNAPNLGVAPHTHEIGFGLDDPVSARRIKPGLVYRRPDDPGLTVYITPFNYKASTGADALWPGGTLALTTPATTGKKYWVKVGINPATGAAVAATGTEYPLTSPLTATELADIAFTGYIPLAGVQLRNGQTTIDDEAAFLDCSLVRAGGGTISLSPSFTGITIDNGLADGGELSLASSGYNPWKLDNSSGTLRMFGDSRGVKLQITDGGATSIFGTAAVERGTVTDQAAALVLNEVYQPTSGAGSDIAKAFELSFVDDRRTANLSNQVLRFVYTRAGTATGEPSAFDAAVVIGAVVNASQTAGLELLRTEGASIASGKTLADLRSVFIGDSGGAGTLTTQYGLYIDSLAKGGTNYAIYTVDAVTRIGGTFQHAGSSLGFYNTSAISKPTVTGSRGGNAALASLLTELANLGLITDSTS